MLLYGKVGLYDARTSTLDTITISETRMCTTLQGGSVMPRCAKQAKQYDEVVLTFSMVFPWCYNENIS